MKRLCRLKNNKTRINKRLPGFNPMLWFEINTRSVYFNVWYELLDEHPME